ncbi:uncharacterized protein Ir67a [Drosophila tropicalis]|uniref:uncharacterized protein Ir67a n=1 Tax=Drosophila tropicalis TaxID=46794 RepID=UPI0035AB873D
MVRNIELWVALDQNLQNMRHVRLMFIIQEKKQLEFIAQMAEEMQFLQVAAILGRTLYRLKPFFVQNRWHIVRDGFIYSKVNDYQGNLLLTLPDQFPPRSLVYYDKERQHLRATGYVTKLIEEFVRRYNITLRWERSIQPERQLSLILLRNMTLNRTISLPLSLCGYEAPSEMGVFSYPYDFSKWFIMVPCAQEIPTAEVYIVICSLKLLAVLIGCYFIFALLDSCFGWLLLEKKFNWSSNLWFNERLIAGMMGQSFKLNAHNMLSSRVTHALLFLLGLVISTLYAAHLKTLLTKRPTQREIATFEDLRNRHDVSIYFDEAERFYLNMFDGARPMDTIRSRITYRQTKEFLALRNRLNRSRAFSTSTGEWLITAKRQELFEKPFHCSHSGLMIGNFILLSVPMQANSIYERPLNRLIHRVHTTGLLGHWKEQTLRKMTELGEISLKDPFHYKKFHEFKVADLAYVGLCLVTGLILGIITFVIEILFGRRS